MLLSVELYTGFLFEFNRVFIRDTRDNDNQIMWYTGDNEPLKVNLLQVFIILF